MKTRGRGRDSSLLGGVEARRRVSIFTEELISTSQEDALDGDAIILSALVRNGGDSGSQLLLLSSGRREVSAIDDESRRHASNLTGNVEFGAKMFNSSSHEEYAGRWRRW